MRLLDRYLLREFMIPLGYCLGGFVILWDAFQLFSELHGFQEKGIRPLDIAAYYFFRTPEFLVYILPMTLLLALLYTLTNHTRHNEITAIRTAGVSLWRLCLPYFAVGFIGTLALFALNEFCVPAASDAAEGILARRVQRNLSVEERQWARGIDFVNTREGRFWHIGAYNRATGEMLNPVLNWNLPDRSSLLIRADRAIRTNRVWTFYHVRELEQTSPTNAFPVKRPMADVMEFPKLTETPREIKNQIVINECLNSRSRTRKADIPVLDIINYLRLDPHPPSSIRPKLYTKLHGRFAGPCACLVVVLVAIPFAAAPGRRNVFVSVAASISIFFIYFFLQQTGLTLGESGRVAAWVAAWMPNIFFAAIGLVMMARVR
jgi:lipopolysaccharide export LptBFGC system permease protein LptF